jgi:hypothetical protein
LLIVLMQVLRGKACNAFRNLFGTNSFAPRYGSSVSSTAWPVALTSLPTPRTVLAQDATSKPQMIRVSGASRVSFMDGIYLLR